MQLQGRLAGCRIDVAPEAFGACGEAGSQPVVFVGPVWLPEHKVRIRKEGSKKMSDTSMNLAGIDTGKGELHVCLRPKGEAFSVRNDRTGIAKLVARCVAAGVVRAGIEATSIYHRAAVKALREAGIEAIELQPRQARGFAVALLRRAKNDTIDASIIARLVEVLDGPWKQPPPAHLEALAEALTYIEMIDDRLVVLKTQRERFTSKRLLDRFDKDIKALEKQHRSELRRLVARLRDDQAMSDKFDLLMSIPTVGERTAAAMLIRMPELGSMTREQAASLLGVAPFDDKSADRDGQRHIAGGRARLRKTVYMAAFAGSQRWNEDLKRFYERLRAKGKAHNAAVTACARKLIILANAVLMRGTPWQDKRGMPCLEN
jgi:transposase